MTDLYFEDFTVGRIFRTAGATLTEGMIVDFALTYDPQPFHIDGEAAKATPFGGLIASGFQTLALTFRLFAQTGALAAAGIGSGGLDELRWLRPVRPGDTLRMEAEVVEQRPSSSKADRGSARLAYRTFNQRGELVMTCFCHHLLKRRPG